MIGFIITFATGIIILVIFTVWLIFMHLDNSSDIIAKEREDNERESQGL